MSTQVVWNSFSDYIRNFIKQKVKPEDVDDILQDVFVKIHLNLDSLKNKNKLKSWIFQITRNVINDYYKSKQQPEVEFIEKQDEPKHHHPGDCLLPLINNLPEKYSAALILSEVKGLKQQEVADELGISLSGAKSRIQRGKDMLKQGFMDCCNYQLSEKGTLVGEHHDKDDCSVCN